MAILFVYVTAADEDEAHRIGETVVAERLAACANVVGAIGSVYWWNGGMSRDREAALVVKTVEENLAPLVARIKSLHSYAVPCIVALPIVGGNPDYLAWVEAESGPQRKDRDR